ncbi:hypothetical protein DH2020_034315 [Rehmannia glutinosa]|uniref:Polynucleotide phosphorylase 1 n=1 Tax=Rehmannia glutinosa TaxID=99300 RepID=A0ABR0V9S9_REHGL
MLAANPNSSFIPLSQLKASNSKKLKIFSHFSPVYFSFILSPNAVLRTPRTRKRRNRSSRWSIYSCNQFSIEASLAAETGIQNEEAPQQSFAPYSIKIPVGDRHIFVETGHMGRQASGAVTVTDGETIIYTTVCLSDVPSEPSDFFPLSVNYQERFSAAGRTRALSEVPNSKAIAGVRIGLIGDKFVVNPTTKEMEDSKLDLLLAGTDSAILMIEGYCNFLPEEKLLQAVEVGQDAVRVICKEVESLVKKCGKPKMLDAIKLPPLELYKHVEEIAGDELVEALQIKNKIPRRKALSSLEAKLFSEVDVKLVFKEVSSRFLRRRIVEGGKRSDGRTPEELRSINSRCGLLPRAHGSALFTRGETQSLAVVTLGDKQMAQRLDNLVDEDEFKRFYLQYSFPPSCVGEVGRAGAPSRREIGHGMLAERALEPILPSEDDFPYTVRVESTITESNGSSSMASVCGGCLALQDAGVPVKGSIAGIAMGMVLDTKEFGGDGTPLILSDITGGEDASGDMDFKVAGNDDGVTAFQMDIKVKPDKVNLIIGSGGKKVKSIIEESGVESIDTQDNGVVKITAKDLSSLEKSKAIISNLTMVPTVKRHFQVSFLPLNFLDAHKYPFLEKRIVRARLLAEFINEKGQLRLSRRALLPEPNPEKPSTKLRSGNPTKESTDSQKAYEKSNKQKNTSSGPNSDVEVDNAEPPEDKSVEDKFVKRLVSSGKDTDKIRPKKNSSKPVDDISRKNESAVVNGDAKFG